MHELKWLCLLNPNLAHTKGGTNLKFLTRTLCNLHDIQGSISLLTKVFDLESLEFSIKG